MSMSGQPNTEELFRQDVRARVTLGLTLPIDQHDYNFGPYTTDVSHFDNKKRHMAAHIDAIVCKRLRSAHDLYKTKHRICIPREGRDTVQRAGCDPD